MSMTQVIGGITAVIAGFIAWICSGPNSVPASKTTTSSHLTSWATLVLLGSLSWNLFLMYDAHRRPNPPSPLRTVGLIFHSVPAAFLLATTSIAQSAEDPALVVFVALLAFRHWRTIVNIFFWFRYQPALATKNPKIMAEDCTVIVPTVGPEGNTVYTEMVTAILYNNPAHLIFSTNTHTAKNDVERALEHIRAEIKTGSTTYQQQHGLESFKYRTKVEILNADVSDKRTQVVHATKSVETKIMVMVDDTAIWDPRFLAATLPAFTSEKVGLVGTFKWVKRIVPPHNPSVSFLSDMWTRYKLGLWNTIGGLYLIRHNFEIRATNAADGGVFCVSGRTSLIRASIVKDQEFARQFTNEYHLGFGPVKADDHNFITRWVLNHNYDIKIQCTKEATITTVLGQEPLKFPDQCKRWSRTTFRQNPVALFFDRTIWWEWPLMVWTTYLPWLYNAALLWDGLLVYTLTRTHKYANYMHHTAMLRGLIFLHLDDEAGQDDSMVLGVSHGFPLVPRVCVLALCTQSLDSVYLLGRGMEWP
ncbi:hypothetical protein BDW02DRAFT_624040 [Decorospora gaudefroyi]|uniref:Glycosyltransferase family 2 protein n=1 Tax=Decorospora gaudefroyi TaxID=184978 RepID=A0A6A5KXV4_9PLEO|nr:hypothetical protein BDW02DRAFT_624040 [Decorospora gaudefroyi]